LTPSPPGEDGARASSVEDVPQAESTRAQIAARAAKEGLRSRGRPIALKLVSKTLPPARDSR
jgi:hypothetical protein